MANIDADGIEFGRYLSENDSQNMARLLDRLRSGGMIESITDPDADKSTDLLKMAAEWPVNNSDGKKPLETQSEVYNRLTPRAKQRYFSGFTPSISVDEYHPPVVAPAAGRRRTIKKRFKRCVMKVAKSKGESRAIAICVRSVLNKRGLTLKRFSKKGVVTQKLKPSKK